MARSELRYFPSGAPPLDIENLSLWLLQELENVSTVLEANMARELFAEPTKLFTGLIVLADGTAWDPGSGRGMYWYDAALPGWNFLG